MPDDTQKPKEKVISWEAIIVFIVLLIIIYVLDSFTPFVPDGLFAEVLVGIIFSVLAKYGVIVTKDK